ncbi:hypothetical protein Acidovoranil_21740 [Acidovorax sp. FG27]
MEATTCRLPQARREVTGTPHGGSVGASAAVAYTAAMPSPLSRMPNHPTLPAPDRAVLCAIAAAKGTGPHAKPRRGQRTPALS